MEINSAPAFVLETPVKFSALAVKQVKKLLMEQPTGNDKALRVGVKGGGCSGLTYVLEFDSIAADDQIFMIDDIKIIMNKAHGMYLFNMEIDFPEGLDARGFVFNNPNAEKTCGCGQSFSA